MFPLGEFEKMKKFEGYDIIGDIHGEYYMLVELLEKLGYVLKDGVYSHPTRKVVFLGDFIDRGEYPILVLNLVKKMVERGSALAVMGNHEFNAIMAYEGYRKLPESDVHYPFYSDMKANFPTLHKMYIEWFKTLPVCLDIGGMIAVHACWDSNLYKEIKEKGLLDENNVIKEWVYKKYNNDASVRLPLKSMLKGKEEKLPDGVTLIDKDGNVRTNRRIPWWNTYDEGTLVACGHYWLKADAPSVLSDKVVCVDYSAVKGGFLCAYRFNVGDVCVKGENFVTVS